MQVPRRIGKQHVEALERAHAAKDMNPKGGEGHGGQRPENGGAGLPERRRLGVEGTIPGHGALTAQSSGQQPGGQGSSRGDEGQTVGGNSRAAGRGLARRQDGDTPTQKQGAPEKLGEGEGRPGQRPP